ncbi:MAG: prolipoprotein diacylglyceryl transferase [Acidobacteria bacterium]|nr:MAG: prolipoprotein diacylglyceryl transferase [Acidobacteriota bacterium]REJ99132.1 MAG: prolipoprotein diacylglyceryl transferase [Acidobacteriota bacterium]REK16147.1 MAG: prolipoprotein diacylglyceryl transferase [Acidobacteriota bacterium]REK43828.1 MAG: prolipoprotein diacylglyceryl transferase [Acidobacteriota bacterium]
MYPELFRIGDFPINTYGVLLAAGLILALFTAAKLAQRDGLPKERIYDLGLWTILGGLLGSKILMLFVDPNVEIFSLDFLRSGGVYFGGFIGGFMTLAILLRFYKLPFWKVGDAFAPGVALGQVLGRQGCFSAGCCWGRPTDLPWGVHFGEAGHANTGVPIYGPDGADLFLHPTQLYESFAMLAVFGFLLYLHRNKKFDGQVLIAYAIIYSIFRFLIEFVRDDPRGDILGITSLSGLSTSQVISLLVAAGATALLVKMWKGSGSKSEPEEASTE